MSTLHECQSALRAWGERSNIVVDADEEVFVTVSRTSGKKEQFKLLGVLFDNKLVMDDAVSKVVNTANAELRAFLRARMFMVLAEVVLQCIQHAGLLAHAHAPRSGVEAASGLARSSRLCLSWRGVSLRHR